MKKNNRVATAETLYAKRGIEAQAIGVLKDKLAFGYVPSKHASINEAFALLNILAYNCMAIMKYIMTTKGNDYIKGLVNNNPRIKTLKFLMLDIAARITRSGRQGKAWVSITDTKWFCMLRAWWNACYRYGLFYCRE